MPKYFTFVNLFFQKEKNYVVYIMHEFKKNIYLKVLNN